MNRQPVTSASIRSIGHDPATNTLEVEFNSGKVYRHSDFTAEDFAQFSNAESIGKHYNAAIKGQFEHELVPEDDDAAASQGSV